MLAAYIVGIIQLTGLLAVVVIVVVVVVVVVVIVVVIVIGIEAVYYKIAP